VDTTTITMITTKENNIKITKRKAA
jgi:hypothetical protein